MHLRPILSIFRYFTDVNERRTMSQIIATAELKVTGTHEVFRTSRCASRYRRCGFSLFHYSWWTSITEIPPPSGLHFRNTGSLAFDGANQEFDWNFCGHSSKFRNTSPAMTTTFVPSTSPWHTKESWATVRSCGNSSGVLMETVGHCYLRTSTLISLIESWQEFVNI